MHHCYYAAGRYQWPGGAPRLLSYGYLGVEVFFVLSGFCLANPVVNRSNIDWILYAKRRARRILPAYFGAVLVFAAIGFCVAHFQIRPLSDIHFLELPPTARQFVYVIALIGVWFNPVFWTLTVEARWYFVFPLCITLQRRFGSAALFAAAVLVAIAAAIARPHLAGRAEFIIGPLPLFMPLFAMGIIIALIAKRGVFPARLIGWNRAGIVVSIALILVLTPAHPADFDWRRIAPAGALAATLLLAALFDPPIRRALSGRWIVLVGVISYSLYLVHLPLVQACYAWSSHWAWPEWLQLVIYEGVIAPLCVLVAFPFYAAFERPFLALAPSRRTAVVELDSHGNPVETARATPDR